MFVKIVGAFCVPDNFLSFLLNGYDMVPFGKHDAQAGMLFVFRE